MFFPKTASFWDPELLFLVVEREVAGAGVLWGLEGVSSQQKKEFAFEKIALQMSLVGASVYPVFM